MKRNDEILFNDDDLDFTDDKMTNETEGNTEYVDEDEMFKNSVFQSCRSWESMCQIEFDPSFLIDSRLSQNTKIVMAAFYSMTQVKGGGVCSEFIEKCIPDTYNVSKVMDTAVEEMQKCGYLDKMDGGWFLTYCAKNNRPLNF